MKDIAFGKVKLHRFDHSSVTFRVRAVVLKEEKLSSIHHANEGFMYFYMLVKSYCMHAYTNTVGGQQMLQHMLAKYSHPIQSPQSKNSFDPKPTPNNMK